MRAQRKNNSPFADSSLLAHFIQAEANSIRREKKLKKFRQSQLTYLPYSNENDVE